MYCKALCMKEKCLNRALLISNSMSTCKPMTSQFFLHPTLVLLWPQWICFVFPASQCQHQRGFLPNTSWKCVFILYFSFVRVLCVQMAHRVDSWSRTSMFSDLLWWELHNTWKWLKGKGKVKFFRRWSGVRRAQVEHGMCVSLSQSCPPNDFSPNVRAGLLKLARNCQHRLGRNFPSVWKLQLLLSQKQSGNEWF